MIRLTATTQKIQLQLGGAVTTNELPITVSYSDKTTTAYNGGVQLSNSTGATPVDICSAPAASTVRDIDYISIYNRDSVAQTVTIIYDNNGTDYILCAVAMDSGDQLQYIHGQGWHTQDADGKVKSTGGGGGSTLPVVDTTSIVEGSVDPTKEMRFEVDQNTTAQTRVMYVPDYDWQMGYPRNVAIMDFTIPADTSYIVANSFDDGGFVVTIDGTLGII
jgi:hypothetical protein